jgi:hypothetical protein
MHPAVSIICCCLSRHTCSCWPVGPATNKCCAKHYRKPNKAPCNREPCHPTSTTPAPPLLLLLLLLQVRLQAAHTPLMPVTRHNKNSRDEYTACPAYPAVISRPCLQTTMPAQHTQHTMRRYTYRNILQHKGAISEQCVVASAQPGSRALTCEAAAAAKPRKNAAT